MGCLMYMSIRVAQCPEYRGERSGVKTTIRGLERVWLRSPVVSGVEIVSLSRGPTSKEGPIKEDASPPTA